MKMIVADCAMLSQQHNFDEQKINYWDVFQETADLITFTEEILNRKFYFFLQWNGEKRTKEVKLNKFCDHL